MVSCAKVKKGIEILRLEYWDFSITNSADGFLFFIEIINAILRIQLV